MSQEDLIAGHGGQIDAMAHAFHDAPLPWIDLSTGINPFPYSVPDLSADAWTRLPTASLRQACEAAMATAFGCRIDSCRAVAGTEVAIRQLPAVLGSERVAVRAPSYADHAMSWRAAGAQVVTLPDPLDAVGRVDVVVIVDPNNPDGRRWPRERIESARAELAARGGWLIIDEAYADLDPSRSMAPCAGDAGLIVLRSFGKFFGLAGVRLGAVLAPTALLAALSESLGGWDVSGPALSIGSKAYGDTHWQEDMRSRLARAAGDLSAVLQNSGLEDIGGTHLFRYVRSRDAVACWRRLAEQGIAVRRFAGDNHHLRIGLPVDERARGRLAEALNP